MSNVQIKEMVVPGQTKVNEQERVSAQEQLQAANSMRIEESIISLIQSINSALHDQKCKVVQFLSSRSGEGSSKIVRKLSTTLAYQYNRKVLVLDSDRKHPTHASAFRVKTKVSWDNVALDGIPNQEAYSQVNNSSLYVGQLRADQNPSLQILDHQQLSGFFNDLRDQFHYILIDSSPINQSQESLVLSRSVDGIIMIVEAESTRFEVAEKTKNLIRTHGGNILGVVLNKRRYPIPNFIYRWL